MRRPQEGETRAQRQSSSSGTGWTERGPLLEHTDDSIRILGTQDRVVVRTKPSAGAQAAQATASADRARFFPPLLPPLRAMNATRLFTVALDCDFTSGLSRLREAGLSTLKQLPDVGEH
jgi:hypothetical protein